MSVGDSDSNQIESRIRWAHNAGISVPMMGYFGANLVIH